MLRALALVCIVTAAASAQPADNKVDAQSLMQSGVKLLEAKDYLGALAVFKTAYERFPSTKILLNIGTTLKYLDRDGNGFLSDFERDADGDGIANMDETRTNINLARIVTSQSEEDAGFYDFGVFTPVYIEKAAEASKQDKCGGVNQVPFFCVDQAQPAFGDALMHGNERRQVVDVLEDLADGLQDDREGRVARRHLEQLSRSLPLLPERSSPAGVATWQQQGSCGALAEAGGKER